MHPFLGPNSAITPPARRYVCVCGEAGSGESGIHLLRGRYDPWIWNVILARGGGEVGISGGKMLAWLRVVCLAPLFTLRLDSITSINAAHNRLCASVRAQ